MTREQLKTLADHGFRAADARHVAETVGSDATAGGIFPHGANGDFTDPNIEAFKNKYCSWWGIAKILMELAKIFTGPKGDRVLDELIALGNRVCGSGAQS